MQETRPIVNDLSPRSKSVRSPWSPVNPKYYEDSSSEDEEDDIDHDQGDRGRFVLPLTPSPSNLSGPPAQNIVIPQLDSSLSDVEEQDDPDLNVLDSDYDQDLSSPLGLNNINEASVPVQDVSPSQNEETVYAEVTVPDLETLEGSAPEVSLTDEDINHLDDFFEEIGAVGANVNVQESSDSPSDQEPEEYVRQFTPEHVPEQPNLENVVQDDDS